MPRTPKPWFWKARNGWYAHVRGRRLRLGDTEPEARAALRALQLQPGRSGTVAGLFDAYLSTVQQTRKPRTLDNYRWFLQRFLDDVGDLRIAAVSPERVSRWLASRTTWNATTRNDAAVVLQMAFTWAHRQGMIAANPLAHLPKPKRLTRTTPVRDDEFQSLLAAVPDAAFRDLLTLCWECGARPPEVNRLEARHLDLPRARAVIPGSESKGGRDRTIYLTDKALEIVRRLASVHSAGPLLRNRRGTPWNAMAVHARFRRLRKRIGRQVRQYDFRHSWVTRKLLAGVDSHVVAKLAGHASTRMLDQTYSHIVEDHEFMQSAAAQEPARTGAAGCGPAVPAAPSSPGQCTPGGPSAETGHARRRGDSRCPS